jgi:hypothetical protein
MMPLSAFSTDQYVNGLRLLRVVRLRRELRSLWRLALLATPIWVGLIIWLQASTPDDSSAWNWADAAVGIGFVVIAALFVVGIGGLILLRFAAGMTGRVAAAFVPVASRGAEATVVGDADALRGLLPKLRRKPMVSIGLVLLFLLFTGVAVFAAINVVPVYQANQGDGGTTVTIGKDARISGYRDTQSSGRYSSSHRDYFLSTPDGTAIAEDSKPVDGQQWLVQPNSLGNAKAYLIGGHDYLLVGGLLLFAAVVDALILLGMYSSFRQESRLRMAAGHVPLAYSVRRLASGARPVVRFDLVRSITLGLPPLPDDSDAAASALLNRRRLQVGIAVVVVLGVVVGVVAITRKTPVPPPPATDKEVTLPYLSGTTWSPDAEVFYSDTDSVRALAVDILRDGGVSGKPTVGAVWSLVVSSQAASDEIDADVDVVGIGGASPVKAVAGGVALRKEVAEDGAPAPVAITGLPSGWSGILTDGKPKGNDRRASVYGSAAGTLVEISVEGGGNDTTLGRRAAEIATAIAHRGVAGFVKDTAR